MGGGRGKPEFIDVGPVGRRGRISKLREGKRHRMFGKTVSFDGIGEVL